ncbi:GNAT family N-acetyltransferase [Psychrobacillus antarcticus]|uniref:GNAT family N-acetyltransferase n=1 Tax=Psychrobacillus antarcticus TaxID=2879115 RepID=UPI0024084530|nr:GNAT family N-acetyltransferase [Psychrobacillus antarcticus]
MNLNKLEQAEIQTLASRLNVIQSIEGNPMGVHELVKGTTRAFAVKHIPGPAFNTVRGLNEQDLSHIEEIFRFYENLSINFRVEITPPNSSEVLFRKLAELGFYQSGFHASFIGEVEDLKASIPPSVEIRSLKKDEFDLFASIYVAAFGLPAFIQDGIKQNNEVLFEVPGWEFFVAYKQEVPVGIAVLYVQGELATLAAAATLPAYRNMGVQSELLQKRVEIAMKKGVRHLTSEAAYGSGSHRNMERAGLKLAYTKAIWTKF